MTFTTIPDSSLVNNADFHQAPSRDGAMPQEPVQRPHTPQTASGEKAKARAILAAIRMLQAVEQVGLGVGMNLGAVMGNALAPSLQPSHAPAAPAAAPQTKLCPKCNAALPAGAKFCNECGASLRPAACPKCGATPTPGAKFCIECGTAINP